MAKQFRSLQNEIAGRVSESITVATQYPLLRNEGNMAFERYAALQKVSVLKKYADQDPKKALLRESRSIKQFLDNLQRVRQHSLRAEPLLHQHEQVLSIAAGLISHVLKEFNLEEVYTEARHSAGTTIGTTYALSNMENKWTYPLSTTPRVRMVFEEYLLWDRQLAGLLADYNKMSVAPLYQEVLGNRVTCVPKTSEVDRVIASEPTLNMFFQQGTMALMVNRLKDFGLDLANLPDHHRDLVVVNSVTRFLATIDFSMASDSLAIWLIRRLFPRDWFTWLMTVRSPCNYDAKKKQVKGWYPIISSMGNATTFPVETLVFWALAQAVKQVTVSPHGCIPDITLCDINQISVFGDDVLLPTTLAPRYINLCEDLGLLVNREKSYFNDERFRESCGVDCYDARNVRPFYLKAAPVDSKTGTEAWLYTCFNKLKPIAISAYGPLVWQYMEPIHLILRELHSLTGGEIKPVPDYMPDDSGVKIFDLPVLHDIMRHNGWRTLPIGVDQHGTLTFQYLRAIYHSKGPRSDGLTYATILKRSLHTAEVPRFYLDKKALAYVKRKTTTCFAQWV